MTIQSTKALIASGQTESALKQLMELAGKANPETQQTAILLSASWENQQREASRGALSYEEANIQRNRIAKGALDLITDLEYMGVVSLSTKSGLQQDLWNNQTAALMQNYANNHTSVNSKGEANIIVGQGNTIHQKKVTGFGIRQFVTILLTLTLLGGGGYLAYGNLFTVHNKTYASITDIQKELTALAELNGDLKVAFDKNRVLIESQLTKGINALDAKDYPRAIQYLEKVAEQTPASSVYQNIAFAYEQMGKQDKASEARAKIKGVTSTVVANKKPVAQLKGPSFNVLAAENGGKIVATSSPDHKKWTDGIENNDAVNGWVIYGFDANVTVNEFRILISSSGNNPEEVKLSYTNDSPMGNFTVIDTFKPFNGLVTDSPYQKFSFPAISAKYIKIENPSYSWIKELQLWGTKE
jgi:tetratricopeptide (TPR) repeat protein